ncbi:MAG: formyltransferase family protein [Pseudomonadota bacterium]
MTKPIRTLFIGGLSNGRIVFDYLTKNRHVDLGLCVTYPDDADRPRHSPFPDAPHILKTGSAKSVMDRIEAYDPELVMVAGWSELVPDRLLKIPRMGVVGFHPSKLPMDRGRSVLAWQIADGYTETALSMFYYATVPDSGDIIGQERIPISENDYIGDVLDKIDAATRSLMRAYFPLFRQGLAPRRPQSLNDVNFRRLRTSDDSEIDWSRDSRDIYNLVRAISDPYPCATTTLDGQRFLVKRAEILDGFPFGAGELPGTQVAKLYDDTRVVRTRDGFIRLTDTARV